MQVRGTVRQFLAGEAGLTLIAFNARTVYDIKVPVCETLYVAVFYHCNFVVVTIIVICNVNVVMSFVVTFVTLTLTGGRRSRDHEVICSRCWWSILRQRDYGSGDSSEVQAGS